MTVYKQKPKLGRQEKQLVTCDKEFWDSPRARLYQRLDTDLVDPESPMAKYFIGWAPGTKVYYKKTGNVKRGIPIEVGLREIPAAPEPEKKIIVDGRSMTESEAEIYEARKKEIFAQAEEDAKKKLEAAKKGEKNLKK